MSYRHEFQKHCLCEIGKVAVPVRIPSLHVQWPSHGKWIWIHETSEHKISLYGFCATARLKNNPEPSYVVRPTLETWGTITNFFRTKRRKKELSPSLRLNISELSWACCLWSDLVLSDQRLGKRDFLTGISLT